MLFTILHVSHWKSVVTHCHPCSCDQKGHHIQVCRLKRITSTVQFYLSPWSRQFLFKFLTKISLWWHKCMGCPWHLPRCMNKLCGHISKIIGRVESHMCLCRADLFFYITEHQEAGELFIAVHAIYRPYTSLCWERSLHFHPCCWESSFNSQLNWRVWQTFWNSIKPNAGVLHPGRYNPMHHCWGLTFGKVSLRRSWGSCWTIFTKNLQN